MGSLLGKAKAGTSPPGNSDRHTDTQ